MSNPSPSESAKMNTTIPSTMRALQWTSAKGGIEKNLVYNKQAPLPKGANNLPKDTVLVKVAYASTNPVDYMVYEMAPFIFSKPGGLGLDYAGVAVKSNLPHIKPGDRLFGGLGPINFGTLADYVVVPKASAALAPEGTKLEDLAAVGVTGLTAYQSVAPFVKQGDHVLINGASGGVGTWAVQHAKALGTHVTAVCSGANAQMIKDLGADEVIDYRSGDLIDILKKKGTKYDHVFDAVFKDPKLYWNVQHFSKPNAKFVTIAGSPSFESIKTFAAIFMLPSFLGGGKRKFQFVTCAANPPELEKIAGWIKEGKVKPVVDQVIDLENGRQAYERQKTGRSRGNIIIKVEE